MAKVMKMLHQLFTKRMNPLFIAKNCKNIDSRIMEIKNQVPYVPDSYKCEKYEDYVDISNDYCNIFQDYLHPELKKSSIGLVAFLLYSDDNSASLE